MMDDRKKTVIHYAAWSEAFDAIEAILSLLPESQLLQAVLLRDGKGNTVLHDLAPEFRNCDTIVSILQLLPESQRQQAVDAKNVFGKTVLQLAYRSTRTSITNLLPRSVFASAWTKAIVGVSVAAAAITPFMRSSEALTSRSVSE